MKNSFRVALCAATLAAGVGLSQAASPAIGQPAPDFTVTDSNGGTQRLSNDKGKYVVLEWINFGCPFIQKHYNSGNMPKLQRTYRAKGVVWYSVLTSAPGKQGYAKGDEINKEMKAHNGDPTAILMDPDGRLGRLYQAKTTPHMFVIDPKGILIYEGAIDSIPSTDIGDIAKATNYVSKALDESMAGEPVSQPATAPYGCSVKY